MELTLWVEQRGSAAVAGNVHGALEAISWNEELAQLGARRVYTAVLVDRHVCQLPIHADIIGMHLQVAAHDIVECNVVLRHGAAQ